MLKKMDGSENRYLRAGIYGESGSGKTRTATEIAIGLCLDEGKKSIAFIDTEGNGIDYMVPIVQNSGLELLGQKTKKFEDLLEVLGEAAKIEECGCIIIDSITHFWEGLITRYLREKGKDFMELWDWGIVKGQWKRFIASFVSVPLHAIICGRAGYVYETERNSRGKLEFYKVERKMKSEGETQYEPSLLIEMEAVPKRKVTGNPKDTGIINRATIIKDRSDTMNGQEIDFPKYSDFEPIIKHLSPNGEHIALHQSKNAGRLFGSQDFERQLWKKKRLALIDRLKIIVADIDDKEKNGLFKMHFGTVSAKEAFNKLPLEELETAIGRIEEGIETI